MLPGNKRSSPCRAALLGIVIGKERAFVGDAVNVGRSAPHHAAMVGTDIPNANIISHDADDVWFLGLRLRRSCCSENRHRNGQHSQKASNEVACFHSFSLAVYFSLFLRMDADAATTKRIAARQPARWRQR